MIAARGVRTLALLLAALVLLPTTGVARAEGKPYPDVEHPEEILALLPGFFEDAEALVREGDREEAWWPDVSRWLTLARNASDAGRFRVAVFDLETFTELLLARHIIEEAEALPNDAERKAFAVQRTNGWKQDADVAWAAYRARLHGYDGQIRSLHTAETALFSADMALTSAMTAAAHPLLAREFPKEPGFDRGYVEALVRYSHTPLLRLGWAEDILQVAADKEGTEPRMKDEVWANLTASSVALGSEGPAYLKEMLEVAKPVRENNESTLSLAFALAEQRAGRLNEMQMQFGDAQSRASVLDDAGRFLGRRLENTTMQAPRDVGLQGVFVADSIDRVLYTLELHQRGNSTLGLILNTWANLDHASYVTAALSQASPVTPPSVEEKDAPLAAWPVVAALGLAALVLARRRR